MKKNLLYKSSIIFSLLFITNIFAQLLLEENFDYTAGDILTDHGWVAHSGGGSNPMTVVSPGLVFPGQPGSGVGNAAWMDNTGEDVHKLFTAPTSGAVYTSVMVVVNASGSASYFMHYAENPHAFNYRGRLFVDDDASNVAFGLSFSSGGGEVYTGFDYNFGETYLLVFKYEIVAGADNDMVSLYVFDSATPPTPTEPGAPTLGPFSAGGASEIEPGSLNFRQFNSSTDIIFDGIIISTTWSDVVGSDGTITIAEAIEDLDGDFVPDKLGQTVTVEGVVFSPNFQSSNNSFYIWDEVAGPGPETFGANNFGGAISRGTDIFMFGPPVFNWAMGDLLQITGEVAQFNGMTEIIPADSSGWVLVSSGNPTPNLIELTLAQYKADPEAYEGSLLGFISLTLVGGTWPTSSSANLQFSDGIDTVTFRIDSDTDIPGQTEPTWPQDILGIGSQFDNSSPFNSGYQIFPRFYATDFLPPNTIPVELTSFAASVNGNSVTLNWTTASELNNSGFDILRQTQNNQWNKIGFRAGFGTTTEIHSYSFVDENLPSGKYAYGLKQVDFDGTFELSDVVNVEVTNPVKYDLSQNYPNPFNPSTTIKFTLAKSGNVTLKIYNTLGEEVALLVNRIMESGTHEVNFNALNLNSGIYFYRIEAGDFSQVKKMTLLK